MTRRGAVIALHWGTLMLVLAMVEGGSAAPALRWTFVATATLWVGLAVVRGLAGRPGPKLTGAARALYRPMHIGLYALTGVAAVWNAAELTGLASPGGAWVMLLVLLSAAAFHGIFHVWRHTALYDGALRVMMPRVLHRFL